MQNGIQIGTPFAFCEEAGFASDIKSTVVEKSLNNELEIKTDLRASSSNYPFKIVQIDDSLSNSKDYEERPRVCDLGYLRTVYKNADGTIGYRCPGEPVEQFVKKGGVKSDTAGRKCLCNGLLSAVDYPQIQASGYIEKPLVTAGKCINEISRFLTDGKSSYSAEDVVNKILST